MEDRAGPVAFTSEDQSYSEFLRITEKVRPKDPGGSLLGGQNYGGKQGWVEGRS